MIQYTKNGKAVFEAHSLFIEKNGELKFIGFGVYNIEDEVPSGKPIFFAPTSEKIERIIKLNESRHPEYYLLELNDPEAQIAVTPEVIEDLLKGKTFEVPDIDWSQVITQDQLAHNNLKELALQAYGVELTDEQVNQIREAGYCLLHAGIPVTIIEKIEDMILYMWLKK